MKNALSRLILGPASSTDQRYHAIEKPSDATGARATLLLGKAAFAHKARRNAQAILLIDEPTGGALHELAQVGAALGQIWQLHLFVQDVVHPLLANGQKIRIAAVGEATHLGWTLQLLHPDLVDGSQPPAYTPSSHRRRPPAQTAELNAEQRLLGMIHTYRAVLADPARVSSWFAYHGSAELLRRAAAEPWIELGTSTVKAYYQSARQQLALAVVQAKYGF